MAGAGVPVRDQVRQSSPGLRNEEARALVHLSPFADFHVLYSAIDAPNSAAAAAYGDAFSILGVDRLLVAVDYTEGTTTTGVSLIFQVSDSKSPDAVWYDVLEDNGAGTGVLVQKVYTAALADSGRVAFVFPVPGGAYCRVKPFVNGATPANSRITVKARRQMSAR